MAGELASSTGSPMLSLPPCEAADADFSWEEAWYPIGIAADMDTGAVLSRHLLGKALVLWHDGRQWRSALDACPHR